MRTIAAVLVYVRSCVLRAWFIEGSSADDVQLLDFVLMYICGDNEVIFTTSADDSRIEMILRTTWWQ